MADRYSKWRPYALLILGIAALFGLRGTVFSDGLKGVGGEAARLAYVTRVRLRQGWGGGRPAVGDLQAEVRRLRTQTALLFLKIWHDEEIRVENRALRAYYRLPEASKYPLVLCEVIARDDITGWWDSLWLDRGSDDGLEPGMAVIVPAGFVGVIAEVASELSRVALLTGSECRVGCRLPRTGAFGILRAGDAGLQCDIPVAMFAPSPGCQMEHVDPGAPVDTGDSVVTSGLDGRIPSGLPVGCVTQMGANSGGIALSLTLEPAVQLSKLRHVFVIIH